MAHANPVCPQQRGKQQTPFQGLARRYDAVWLEGEWFNLGDARMFVGKDACDFEVERRHALLSIAFGRLLTERDAAQVEKAVAHIRESDPTLANLRLAHARLSRLPVPVGASERLALADAVLAAGLSAATLMRAVFANDRPADENGMDDRAACERAILAKFDPDQLRIPAGSGPKSGRWTTGSTSSDSNGAASPRAATALALPGASLLLPEVGAGTITALSAFVAGVGFAAVFGFLFVPTPNSQSSEGALPGSSGARYTYNHDEGRLRIQNADGALLAQGQRDRNGVFHDFETGVPFAREVNGALVFDGDAVREDPDTTSVPHVLPHVEEEENEPKLCPAPTEDKEGAESASPRAKAYQEQISLLINGTKALKFGMAMRLFNPRSGRFVYYDDCEQQTGTMIEAKGPGYAKLFTNSYVGGIAREKLIEQGERQLQAAGNRKVEWYFAEEAAANDIRQQFAERGGLKRISIHVEPAVMQ